MWIFVSPETVKAFSSKKRIVHCSLSRCRVNIRPRGVLALLRPVGKVWWLAPAMFFPDLVICLSISALLNNGAFSNDVPQLKEGNAAARVSVREVLGVDSSSVTIVDAEEDTAIAWIFRLVYICDSSGSTMI